VPTCLKASLWLFVCWDEFSEKPAGALWDLGLKMLFFLGVITRSIFKFEYIDYNNSIENDDISNNKKKFDLQYNKFHIQKFYELAIFEKIILLLEK
jgi:hypothetical protein